MSVLGQVEMGSTVVALGLLVLVGAIMVAAIFRFRSMDDILKLWAGLGTLVGLIVGTMGTYFFTKDVADRSIAKVEAEKSVLNTENRAAKEAVAALTAKYDAEKRALTAENEALAAKFDASRIIMWTSAAPAKEPEPPAAEKK